MASSNNSVVITFSIAILLLLALLLLVSYNSKCKVNNNIERFDNTAGGSTFDSRSNPNLLASNESDTHNRVSIANIANNNLNTDFIESGIGNLQGSDSLGNEAYDSVENSSKLLTPSDNQSCYNRDRLTSQDLLPKDGGNSKWAQINPASSGDVRDQNYLTAGYHIGVNTVGQSLRNANLQLRSEIPNPQVPVSPWMISTIEPDVRPVSFEIGSSPTY